MNDNFLLDEINSANKSRKKKIYVLIMFLILSVFIGFFVINYSVSKFRKNEIAKPSDNQALYINEDSIPNDSKTAGEVEEEQNNTYVKEQNSNQNNDEQWKENFSRDIRKKYIDKYSKQIKSCSDNLLILTEGVSDRLMSNQSYESPVYINLKNAKVELGDNCAYMPDILPGVDQITKDDLVYIKDNAFKAWDNAATAFTLSDIEGQIEYHDEKEIRAYIRKALEHGVSFSRKYEELNVHQYAL